MYTNIQTAATANNMTLNAMHTLAASCIANTIKPVLNIIIKEDQQGFIKGRYIGENIRIF